jgi:hypothetical protein
MLTSSIDFTLITDEFMLLGTMIQIITNSIYIQEPQTVFKFKALIDNQYYYSGKTTCHVLLLPFLAQKR